MGGWSTKQGKPGSKDAARKTINSLRGIIKVLKKTGIESDEVYTQPLFYRKIRRLCQYIDLELLSIADCEENFRVKHIVCEQIIVCSPPYVFARRAKRCKKS